MNLKNFTKHFLTIVLVAGFGFLAAGSMDESDEVAVKSDKSNYKPADLKWLVTHNDSSLPQPRLFKIPMRIISKEYSAGHYLVRYNDSPAIDLRAISGGDPNITNKLNDLAYSGQPFYGYCEYNIYKNTLYCCFVEY